MISCNIINCTFCSTEYDFPTSYTWQLQQTPNPPGPVRYPAKESSQVFEPGGCMTRAFLLRVYCQRNTRQPASVLTTTTRLQQFTRRETRMSKRTWSESLTSSILEHEARSQHNTQNKRQTSRKISAAQITQQQNTSLIGH